MSENFENTYENSIPDNFSSVIGGDSVPVNFGSSGNDVVTFGSALPGGMGEDHLRINDYWVGDGYSLTGNPYASPDVFSLNSYSIKMNEDTNKNGFWKYNEDKILKQLEQYISGTYSQHYVDRTGGGTEQTLDKIKHNRREGFCAGNVTKYIDRYDTKGTPRADLFKVLHYTILLINHLNLVENK